VAPVEIEPPEIPIFSVKIDSETPIPPHESTRSLEGAVVL
jgi:hypothetical protein